jgi:hypothetical protein
MAAPAMAADKAPKPAVRTAGVFSRLPKIRLPKIRLPKLSTRTRNTMLAGAAAVAMTFALVPTNHDVTLRWDHQWPSTHNPGGYVVHWGDKVAGKDAPPAIPAGSKAITTDYANTKIVSPNARAVTVQVKQTWLQRAMGKETHFQATAFGSKKATPQLEQSKYSNVATWSGVAK